MAEAAAAPAAAPSATPAAAPAATPSPGSAGTTLTSVPTGEWASGFKNETLRTYVKEKNFSDPEKLVESYQNLEKKLGVPADRLLKLPDKMEGDEAMAIYDRLGRPKEAKEYELSKGKSDVDPEFNSWAESTFHSIGLSKSQALSLDSKFTDFQKAFVSKQNETRKSAIIQADAKLKGEWGNQYDANLNIVKQGAKILGLDEKTLNAMEALQGREVLFKNLQRIGKGVGESIFVDGNNNPGNTSEMTPEQASSRIKELMQDKKFGKRLSKGDTEALAEWNKVNRLAAPGEKQIG